MLKWAMMSLMSEIKFMNKNCIARDYTHTSMNWIRTNNERRIEWRGNTKKKK